MYIFIIIFIILLLIYIPTINNFQSNYNIINLLSSQQQLIDINTNSNDVQQLNKNVKTIINDIDYYLDKQPLAIDNNMDVRYPQLITNINFDTNKPLSLINDYYKIKTKLNPNLKQFITILNGKYSIINNQFILLNNWHLNIFTDKIEFIYNDNIILYINIEITDISPINKYILFKLGNNFNILTSHILSNIEIDEFITFLNNIGFNFNKYLYLVTISDNIHAFKSAEFSTLFLIKKQKKINQMSFNATLT